MSTMRFVRPHPRYHIEFVVDGDAGELRLQVNGCLRKARPIGDDGRSYVWTSIELEWEEHRLLEGWLVREGDAYGLIATENGTRVLEERFAL